MNVSAACVSSVVPHSESETPPARPVEEQCHVFDGVSGRQVKANAVHLEALPEQCDGTDTDADPSQGRVVEQHVGFALDLVDGYYQILMRESDIPLTALSTPNGMLW
ncbi:Pol protein [Phytophthora palmivora]|uniref:Pol protein n=1 Tax=Phytophthora palmivora TaxID=4796 RepID=A0A2P4XJQ4_9STRA|nr:Pol protein [Phytophthora palmivora]